MLSVLIKRSTSPPSKAEARVAGVVEVRRPGLDPLRGQVGQFARVAAQGADLARGAGCDQQLDHATPQLPRCSADDDHGQTPCFVVKIHLKGEHEVIIAGHPEHGRTHFEVPR